MTEFTLLDWSVLAIVVSSVAASVARGFVQEIFGLATVVMGLLIAAWFHASLAGVLESFLRTENQALFAAFAILFIGTLIAGVVLTFVVRRFVEFAHIRWFDRLLGGAFGLIRGWLLAAVVFMMLTSFGVGAEVVGDSRLSRYFLPAVRLVTTLTPFELKARFLIGYDEVQRWWADSALNASGDAIPAAEDETAR